MVMDGRRQVGSTIKPFLYSLAMENGFSPCDLAPNVQQTYMVAGRPWTPRNAGHARYGQMVTLKWGLQQSNNWISAYLMSKLNPDAFVQLLHEYGQRKDMREQGWTVEEFRAVFGKYYLPDGWDAESETVVPGTVRHHRWRDGQCIYGFC